MCNEIKVSCLAKTWILDLDGTIVKHNGYKMDGNDTLLPSALSFLQKIPKEDLVIFVTSRDSKYECDTRVFLEQNHIRYDHIIFNAPYGERILINDEKPSGLPTAIAVNVKRDVGIQTSFTQDPNL